MVDRPYPAALDEGAINGIVWRDAPLVLLRLSASGMVIDANPYTRQITGKDPAGLTLDKVFVDFSGTLSTLDLLAQTRATSTWRLHLSAASGLPVCLLFRFAELLSGEVLAIGWHNMQELADLEEQLIGLNSEFSKISRATFKDYQIEIDRQTQSYRLILEAAGEGICGLNAEGRHTFVNPAAAAMLGYSAEELIGTPSRATWYGYSPDGDLHAEEACLICETLSRGIPHTNESGYFRRKDRSLFPVIFTTRPILENRQLTGAVVTFSDITERRQTQETLKASEERHRAILETAMDGFWLADTQGRLLEINETYCRMSGYSAAELLSMRIPDLEAREAAEDTGAHIKWVVSEGEDRFESRHRRKDGSVFDVEVSVQYQPADGGRFVVFLQDITERKRSERLMLLEHAIARCLTVAADATSGIRAVMKAVSEATDWARSTYWRLDEAAGVMCFDTGWDSPGQGLETYTERSRGVVFALGVGLVGRVWQSAEPIWTADFSNDPRAVQRTLGWETGMRSVFVLPVTSESRTIGALAFFSKEIRKPDERLLALTRVIGSELGQFLQRKYAEDKVSRLNAELEQRVADRTRALEVANHELESFSYSVSHDLRAPLRAIEGFSSLLESEYTSQLDERAKDYFRRVRGGATRMGQLIDDLLKLSRISRQEMKVGPVDLSALAQEVAGDLQGAEPERKVDWVIAPKVTAEGDLGLLRVAMQNLIGNAWKYSSKRESARIEFGVRERDGRPLYFVSDNGEGFDMAYADKLFGAFQRLHSTGEFPGSGIGLATVKRIIHRHGGSVGADGNVHEGATFYFTL